MKPDMDAPVLVGVGAKMQPRGTAWEDAHSPVELIGSAVREAMADAGVAGVAGVSGVGGVGGVDGLMMVRMIADSPKASYPFGVWENPPEAVAQGAGIEGVRLFYGSTGGNTPQMLVNRAASMLATGELRAVVVCGGECFATHVRALREGRELPWGGEGQASYEQVGEEKDGSLEVETAHGLDYPVHAYPLIETALAARLGETPSRTRERIGGLFAPFSQVAEGNGLSWFPVARTAGEIATPTVDNRYIGFPYTKYMNAVMQVDQAAAVVMTTLKEALAMGVPMEKCVWLHGGGEAEDVWYMAQRERLDASPAIAAMVRYGLAMAGWQVAEIDFFDIYSCFPSAVAVACEEIGIKANEGRALTVTGGLPYFGGAGNAYAMMSIAEMVRRVRGGGKGMCTANGWFLTKHAVGLYSGAPVLGEWRGLEGFKVAMKEPKKQVAQDPQGKGKVVAWTVAHNRKGRRRGTVLGELAGSGERFVAHVPDNEALLNRMTADEVQWVGCEGEVCRGQVLGKGSHVFTPAGEGG